MRVSIIIPVYNEAPYLREVLERVMNAPLPEGCEREVIVVDDGSTDETASVLHEYSGSGLLAVHHSVLNFGKGTAVRVGLAMATGDIILIQDGDLEYDPSDFSKILEPLIDGSAKVVYGSRFLGHPKEMKWKNWVANKILTLAANVLYDANITDEATAYKAFRAESLKKVKLECRRFEFCPEVTAKMRRLGHKIHEVPIHYNARGVAEGKKIRWQDGFHAMWTLAKYRFAPLKSFCTVQGQPTGRPAVISRIALGLAACLALLVYLFSPAGQLLPVQKILPSLYDTTELLVRGLTAERLLLARYAFQSYGVFSLILIVDLLFGLALLRIGSRRLSLLPPALRAAMGLALGSGAASLFCFGLAIIHRLDSPWVFASTVLSAVAAVAILTWKRAWRWAFSFLSVFRVSRPNRRAAWVLGACLAPVLVLHAFDLMMPVTEYDSTMYHMSAAKLYRQTASLEFHEGLRYNAQPHLPVLSYLRFWFLLGDDSLLKLANIEFTLVLLLALIAAARQLRIRDGWLLAVLFLCTSPNLWWVSKIEYLDLGLMAYFTLGLVLMFHEMRSPSRMTILGAGIMLGLAGACKFYGLALSGLAIIAYAGVSLANGAISKRQLANRLLLLGAIVVLLGAPWWIRSFDHTGSLFYPFFSQSGLEDQQGVFVQNKLLGVGHSLSSFLLMGVYLARMLPFKFGDPYAFGPCLLLLEGSALAVSYRLLGRRRPSPATMFLIGTTLVYFLFWFYTGQVLRYLVPLIPALAILYITLLKRCGYERKLPRAITVILLILAIHAGLVSCTIRKFNEAPPVAFADKTTFLRKTLPFYRAVQVLNATAAPGERTYLLFAQPAWYYVATDAYGDWFSRYNYHWLRSGNPTVAQVIERLRVARFNYLLIDRQGPADFVSPDLAVALKHSDAELPGTARIYDDKRFVVYRIK